MCTPWGLRWSRCEARRNYKKEGVTAPRVAIGRLRESAKNAGARRRKAGKKEGRKEGNQAGRGWKAPSRAIDRHRLLNMAPGVAFAVSVILVVGHLQEGRATHGKTFTFPEYPYKETTKNELLFRQFEQACEESGACKMLPPQENGISKTRCIRECVSPSCYKEIYLFDQLEEGEIDVRLNSFKGCFMQRNGRPRK